MKAILNLGIAANYVLRGPDWEVPINTPEPDFFAPQPKHLVPAGPYWFKAMTDSRESFLMSCVVDESSWVHFDGGVKT